MAVETFTDQNRSDFGFKKRVIGRTYIQNADRKCHPDCRGPHEKQAGFSTLTDDGDDGHSGSAFEEPVKIHCSVLAEDAIKAAINDFRSKNGLEQLVFEERIH